MLLLHQNLGLSIQEICSLSLNLAKLIKQVLDDFCKRIYSKKYQCPPLCDVLNMQAFPQQGKMQELQRRLNFTIGQANLNEERASGTSQVCGYMSFLLDNFVRVCTLTTRALFVKPACREQSCVGA